MVVLDLNDELSPPVEIYFSMVNPDAYSGSAPLSNMQEALIDWGWFGQVSLCPSWYTGHVYSVQPLSAANGFAAR